ncbi:MAG: RDD family protein [Candidatus Izemoplasmatales bacterium]|nr:RDD family protein [bacterium]MDZ4196185.1 RDD family protein [Candidatus Izemoplasmatales bacterium]
MNAGFIRRGVSTFFDFVIVIALIYLSYLGVGRTIIQNQIPYFDELYGAFLEINDAYGEDVERVRLEYDASIELAGGNKDLEAQALANYTTSLTILDQQNLIDIEPYNRPITKFFLNSIYYFAIGFLIVMGIYTVAVKGKTFGRRIMKLELTGKLNPTSIFVHDILLKYFIIVLTLVISIYGGLMVFLLALLVDMALMTFTRNKRTFRDTLLNMDISVQGRGY